MHKDNLVMLQKRSEREKISIKNLRTTFTLRVKREKKSMVLPGKRLKRLMK